MSERVGCGEDCYPDGHGPECVVHVPDEADTEAAAAEGAAGSEPTPVLDVADTLRHMTAAVAASGTGHVDPAAELLTELIYRQVCNPDLEAESAPRTRYTDGTAPLCLVGHVLHAAGVDVAELARLDDGRASRLDQVDISGVAVTPWARWLLSAAQHDQDDAVPWGEVLELTFARADDQALLEALDPDAVAALRDEAERVLDNADAPPDPGFDAEPDDAQEAAAT